MNESALYVVKEFKFDSPLITDIDSKIDQCFGDCHKNFFHNCKCECIYDIKLKNITINETINLTISDGSMNF